MADFQYDIAFSFTKEDEGIASQINDLLQDRYRTFLYGGTGVEETFADRAARLERAQKFEQEKEAFAETEVGVKAFHAAHQTLVSDIKGRSGTLSSVGVRLQERSYDGATMVVGRGVVLWLRCESRYSNSLKGAKLETKFCDGVPPLGGYEWTQPRTLKSWEFTFQLVGPDRSAWVGPDGREHA